MSSKEPSTKESLHALVHTRFREAFGPPHNVAGGGEQWTLEPSLTYSSAIHVVLNGTHNGPNVWIFDPHDSQTGIVNAAIVQARQVDELIDLIQQRVDMADRGRENPPSAKESLHAFVHSRFHEAFGTPHNVQGGGKQWTLDPGAAHASPIYVVLNGTPEGPTVWIFDPQDPVTMAVNTPISRARQVRELITLIELRLKMANLQRDKARLTPPDRPEAAGGRTAS